MTIDTARIVARNKVQQHLDLYGSWNGSTDPELGEGQAVEDNGLAVAYNFQVIPSGHILVAVDDAFSPVLLYSARSTFDPARRSDPNSIESWIIPELHYNTQTLATLRTSAPDALRAMAGNETRQTISSAWKLLTAGRATADTGVSLDGTQRNLTRSVTIGPLLTTIWGQTHPYNLMTPENGCSATLSTDRTLTGCVATSWAQLARYWKWPLQGTGSHSYEWNSNPLTVDFSTATYDWENMPNNLTVSSTQVQKDAVSLLMYHMGVAAEMEYGCSSSGSSAWADETLDLYFNYKSDMQFHARDSYTAAQWFALFKAEFDADPPRPVIFSMFATNGSGHELVADGYQNDGTSLIHLNLGWKGYEDTYYNITSDFEAGGYTWLANSQFIVTHIEPNNNPPIVEAGDDQSVEEETEVQLSGSATDPEGVGIAGYAWTQTTDVDGVSISNSTSANTSFIAPNVDAETTLVFQLRADDANRAYATDTVSITVSNTDGSTAPPPVTRNDGGGGSSGGCFLMSLF